MIVVDTDVIAYAFIRHDAKRVALSDMVTRKDRHWVVPPLWISEFRNVLVCLIRFGGLDPDEARRIVVGAESQLVGRIVAVYSPDVLSLSARSGRTAYDCEYVAAAKSLGTRLVTGDRALAAAFPETAVTMEDFVSGAG